MAITNNNKALKEPVKVRKTKELVKLAALDNYQVIGEYTFSAVKVEFLCDKQHSFHMPPNDFKKGCRCPICAHSKVCVVVRRTANKKKALAAIRFDKILKDKGYTLLQPYNGAHKKISLKCSKEHEFKATPSNIKYGHGCSKCYMQNKATKATNSQKK